MVGADGKPYHSPTKATIWGHRGTKIFGRLDCPSAFRASERGGYVRNRVFFADPTTATRAGYGPCAVCLPDAYRAWQDLASVQGRNGMGGEFPDLTPRLPIVARARTTTAADYGYMSSIWPALVNSVARKPARFAARMFSGRSSMKLTSSGSAFSAARAMA